VSYRRAVRGMLIGRWKEEGELWEKRPRPPAKTGETKGSPVSLRDRRDRTDGMKKKEGEEVGDNGGGLPMGEAKEV